MSVSHVYLSLSYTAVMGIRTDTHLKGQDYSNLALLFYAGFLVAEFPTQFIAQRVGRMGVYLGGNIMCWGLSKCFPPTEPLNWKLP